MKRKKSRKKSSKQQVIDFVSKNQGCSFTDIFYHLFPYGGKPQTSAIYNKLRELIKSMQELEVRILKDKRGFRRAEVRTSTSKKALTPSLTNKLITIQEFNFNQLARMAIAEDSTNRRISKATTKSYIRYATVGYQTLFGDLSPSKLTLADVEQALKDGKQIQMRGKRYSNYSLPVIRQALVQMDKTSIWAKRHDYMKISFSQSPRFCRAISGLPSWNKSRTKTQPRPSETLLLSKKQWQTYEKSGAGCFRHYFTIEQPLVEQPEQPPVELPIAPRKTFWQKIKSLFCGGE